MGSAVLCTTEESKAISSKLGLTKFIRLIRPISPISPIKHKKEEEQITAPLPYLKSWFKLWF